MSEMIKLNAIKESVSFWLYKFHHGTAGVYDPQKVDDLFSRSKVIFDKLRLEKPSYFADLPIRDEKPKKTTDFEGRGARAFTKALKYWNGVFSLGDDVAVPALGQSNFLFFGFDLFFISVTFIVL